jgi:hypothetical protein
MPGHRTNDFSAPAAVTHSQGDPNATTCGQLAAGSSAPLPVTAGRYMLGAEIAHGGMGGIYRATDTVLSLFDLVPGPSGAVRLLAAISLPAPRSSASSGVETRTVSGAVFPLDRDSVRRRMGNSESLRVLVERAVPCDRLH